MIQELQQNALALLKDLIETPSFSSEEHDAVSRIEKWFGKYEIEFKRQKNNIYSFNKYFDESKPTLLLNSHHDTVYPNEAYTRDPFKASVEEGKLFGLGSNDAGGALVSLIATFTYFYEKKDLNYNLILAATAEEESSGTDDLSLLLPILPKIDVAIVGEPTQMQLAVAEKGLVVFDAIIEGTASHAAHPNEDNPIMKLPKVLNWFKDLKFDKVSEALGEVKVTVTQVAAGKQHNVVPSQVHLVVDVRVNDCYTNKEIVEILKSNAPCVLKERNTKLNSSSIPVEHPLVQAGISIGRTTYGSPTLSDQAKLSCPSLKLGPGDSIRSHSANEFIYVNEVTEAVDLYITILNKIL